MPLFGRGLGIAFGVLITACAQDAIDSAHRCQVVSPNDRWTRNNITQVVTAPSCPVRLNHLGEGQTFAATIKGPAGISFGYVDSYFYNAKSEFIGHSFGLWQAYDRDHDVAYDNGGYAAGTAGAQGAPVDDDLSETETTLSAAYGGGLAKATVILPYTCCSVSASISQNHNPVHGVSTIVRIITNGVSQQAQIRWLLDGVQVIPGGPTAQAKRDTIWAGTVKTAGTHTWRVNITEPIPGGRSQTLNWTQVYR